MTDLTEVFITCPVCGSPNTSGTKFCAVCGRKMNTTTLDESAPILEPEVPQEKKNRLGIILTSVAAALLLLLNMVFLIDDLFTRKKLDQANDTIAQKEYTVDELRDNKTQLEATVDALEDRVDELEATVILRDETIQALTKDSKAYDAIVSGMGSGKAGYGADNFYVNDSVVVVKKGDNSQKIKLTAQWDSGATVTISYSSSAAKLSFDTDGWERDTMLSVKPNAPGVTIATFTNSADNNTFQVLIIVTE